MKQSLLRKSLLVCLAVLLAAGNVRASETEREMAMKVAFVYNFVRFSEFSADSENTGGDFLICISAEDDFFQAFSKLTGKQTHGRTIRLSHLSATDDPVDCETLFVSGKRSNGSNGGEHGSATEALTIADESADDASVFNMYRSENKISFTVNLAAADERNIKVSSKILRLAEKVVQ